jgi:hypothetical protein
MARKPKCPVEIAVRDSEYVVKINAKRYGRRTAVRVYKIALYDDQLVLQYIASAIEERVEKKLYRHEVEDGIAIIAVEIATTIGRELAGVVMNIYPVLIIKKEYGDYVVRQLAREMLRATIFKTHEILDMALNEVELWLSVFRAE